MKSLSRTAAAALVFAAALWAVPAPLCARQVADARPEPAGVEALLARKIDDVDSSVRGCDHGARLDNFAIYLQNDPLATGYVIAYGPPGEGSGTADYRLEVTKDYFVNSRGLEAERIQTVNGGRYKKTGESFVELWLVPPGAEAPRPAEYRNDAGEFKGKYSESEAWDGFEWGEAMGPPVGDSRLAGFADVLKSQPGLRGYVVVLQGEESAPGAWRRVSAREVDALKRYGVAEERVRVIFAGYGKGLKLQLWALPKDAPPPAKGAGAERRPAAATQVARIDDYQLRFEEEARSFFRGFAEVLKADENLSAYLVIRLPAPRDGDGTPPEPLYPGEPPEIDMQRLAEKWRADLRKEYDIGDQRFVVLVVPPKEEWEGSGVEAWVVPAGAAPPDPYAKEDEEEAEEEEQGAEEEGGPEEL